MNVLIKSVETANQAVNAFSQLQPLISKQLFELKKWISNNVKLNAMVREDLQSICKTRQVVLSPNNRGIF